MYNTYFLLGIKLSSFDIYVHADYKSVIKNVVSQFSLENYSSYFFEEKMKIIICHSEIVANV
jgi:hypothetical protein